jgi:hypothetical protein
MENNQIKHPLMKKWWVFLILGPGIFFVIYFFMFNSFDKEKPDPLRLPARYSLSGDIVNTAGGQLKVGLVGENVFSKTIELKNNLVVAETGRQFMIVPVSAPGSGILAAAHKWSVVDSNGLGYDILSVDPDRVAGMVDKDKLKSPPGWVTTYLVFKVRESSEGYYVIMEFSNGDVSSNAWYLPGPS